jgi:tricorn protease-like protein
LKKNVLAPLADFVINDGVILVGKQTCSLPKYKGDWLFLFYVVINTQGAELWTNEQSSHFHKSFI